MAADPVQGIRLSFDHSMSAINHHPCRPLQTVGYLVSRLGYILRHPGELSGFWARAVAIYRAQGWGGVKQGFRRDWRGTREGEGCLDNSGRDYQQWLATEPGSLAVETGCEAAPLFTVLLNASGADVDSLSATFNSLAEQSYAGWELFVSGLSPAARMPSTLNGRLLSQRMQLIEPAYDQTQATSFAGLLAMAAGSYLLPLDCGVVLAKGALAEFAGQLAANQDAVLCYSDHDHVDGQGFRSNPYFKPDWNPLLLLTQCYISPLAAFKTSAIKACGGSSPRLNSFLAWELALSLAANAKPQQIIHLPKMLVHLRLAATRPLRGHDDKALPVAEMVKNITAHLPEWGYAGARLVMTEEGTPRLCALISEPLPKVSIIIPTRNSPDILRRCLDSIFQKTHYQNFEVVIVDNQSDDPALRRYFGELSANPQVRRLTYDAPFNYSAINNFAAQQSHGEVLCFLNNDVEVIAPDWLTELVGHALPIKHGAVGAMLYYPNDRIQHGGIILGRSVNGPGGVAANAFCGLPRGFSGQGGRLRHAQYVSAVTGACLAIRRSVFEEVGGFDQEDLAVVYNDVDLCLRLRERGYKTVLTPVAELYHYESVSRGRDNTDVKQVRFGREVLSMHQRWGKALQHDPYFPSGDLGDCQWQ